MSNVCASDIYSSLVDSLPSTEIPRTLADFIDGLVSHAVDRGVPESDLLTHLARLRGVSLARPDTRFDSRTPNVPEAFVTQRPYLSIYPQFINPDGTLTSTEPLIAMLQFINNSDRDKHSALETMAAESRDGDTLRIKKLTLMADAISSSIKTKNSNGDGRFSKIGPAVLARKLLNMSSPSTQQNLNLSVEELKCLRNPGGLSRPAFISWLLKIAADAANGNRSEATSIYDLDINNYPDLLKVINNMILLCNLEK